MLRVRHCVECSRCHTRYLVSRSPYHNGSYLIPTVQGSLDEYALYCSCQRVLSLWRWCEVMACEVSSAAYERGYGTAEEIFPTIEPREPWSFDAGKYLNWVGSTEKERDPR